MKKTRVECTRSIKDYTFQALCFSPLILHYIFPALAAAKGIFTDIVWMQYINRND
jgi:hypothetical protein